MPPPPLPLITVAAIALRPCRWSSCATAPTHDVTMATSCVCALHPCRRRTRETSCDFSCVVRWWSLERGQCQEAWGLGCGPSTWPMAIPSTAMSACEPSALPLLTALRTAQRQASPDICLLTQGLFCLCCADSQSSKSAAERSATQACGRCHVSDAQT